MLSALFLALTTAARACFPRRGTRRVSTTSTSTATPPRPTLRTLRATALEDLNGGRLSLSELSALSSCLLGEDGLASPNRSQAAAKLRELNTTVSRLFHATPEAAAQRAAVGEILRSVNAIPLLVHFLESPFTQADAFHIVWHLSSDIYEARASETRAELHRARALHHRRHAERRPLE